MAPIPGGMTTGMCIVFCRSQGFTLAGTEAGFQCFCGDVLFDSWLVDEASCNSPCAGGVDASCFCGGDLALSVWSPDGKVKKAFRADHFAMPELSPDQTEMSLAVGGVRQTVVRVTTPVYMWPEAATTTSETSIDVDGIASTVQAIVSAAVREAQAIAASEIAKASSMIADARAAVGKGFESIADELNAYDGDGVQHDSNLQHHYNLHHIRLVLEPLEPFSWPHDSYHGHGHLTIRSCGTKQQSNRHRGYAFSKFANSHADICSLDFKHCFCNSCNGYLLDQSRWCWRSSPHPEQSEFIWAVDGFPDATPANSRVVRANADTVLQHSDDRWGSATAC
ncbi:hypothetical protein B0H67DRAFT_641212 [Lasiosphaeris hirsuta]|uniref:WSC domain-containing protein n=1 Tax=Lasiosphaeris hirsuta TaxID=260670 RepID=A0AA40AZ72_9PEZI|nr:hypothetical protein B0H67DRAFT_641212 [Lasiosphaeris hirsuta]